MWTYPAGSIRGTWNHEIVISRLWQRFQDDGNVSDVTAQVAPVQRRMRTGLSSVFTCNSCRLRLAWVRRACCIVDTATVVACDVFRRVQVWLQSILAGLSYGGAKVPVTTKRTPLNDAPLRW
ncbi:hypothetical protein AVEN_60687-1 [Araneus ventricosus]|uniref:Uncharacterized protein n=1 Tax=Araneus ventricosus TaxID=182803 RepID=A0A4Y2MAP1_ARAVE|nr:hypothetical protein AVEN_60687-1 [Araneus ventricosus]